MAWRTYGDSLDERRYVILTPGYGDGGISPAPPTKRGILTFSRVEKRELGISLAVLTIAFTIARAGGIWNMGSVTPSVLLLLLTASFLSVFTAFVFHEIGHKYVAMSYGMWAEYRYYPQGLLFALFLSFIGFVFAAPGAVMIYGYPTREQNGKISLVGPMINTGVALLAYLFTLAIVAFTVKPIYHLLGWMAMMVAYVNIFLAAFNLLPIPPLDGSKVWRWNMGIYIAAWIVVIAVGIPIFLTF